MRPETCTVQSLLVENPYDELFCIGKLSRHPVMMHTAIFTTQFLHERSVGLPHGKIGRFHLAKALSHLQENLNNRNEATSNDNIAAVTILAMTAILLGELETASKHMDGLARMVELRGGFGSLGRGSVIESKVRRCEPLTHSNLLPSRPNMLIADTL